MCIQCNEYATVERLRENRLCNLSNSFIHKIPIVPVYFQNVVCHLILSKLSLILINCCYFRYFDIEADFRYFDIEADFRYFNIEADFRYFNIEADFRYFNIETDFRYISI